MCVNIKLKENITRVCVRACVRACVRERERERQFSITVKKCIEYKFVLFLCAQTECEKKSSNCGHCFHSSVSV